MTAPHLVSLNPQQRRAVEHGGSNVKEGAGPLLVIAGAGSGKTNTLAHRVGHLVVNGTDPRRNPAADVLAARSGGDDPPG